VHDDVEPAGLADDPADRALAGRRVGDVERQRRDRAAVRGAAHRLVGGIGAAQEAGVDPRALAGELLRDRAPEAARGAGDQRGLPREPAHARTSGAKVSRCRVA
jgi:hypothetical protein